MLADEKACLLGTHHHSLNEEEDSGYLRSRPVTPRTQRSSWPEGVALTWTDVCYTFQPKRSLVNFVKPGGHQKKERLTLNHVSGVVLPGQLLAVMGSSGCGKTTMLDVLAGRLKTGRLSGHILVNGKPRDKYYKRQKGYVTQEDCLKERLTVYQTFMFYAHLRLPSPLSLEQRKERVERVIEELGLGKVRDSMVGGNTVRGISGGERKRVSIGCELITDPSLLFLDEPTTGLDSYNSLGVMDRLSALTAQGRAVVCTIHQPRSTIFQNVDQLMLLSRGSVVYLGPAKHAVSYFAGLHFHIKPFINPADFLLDVVIQNQERFDRAQGNNQRLLSSSTDPDLDPEVCPDLFPEPDFALAKSPAYYIAKDTHKVEVEGDGKGKAKDDDLIQESYHVDMAEAYRNSSLHTSLLETIKEVTGKGGDLDVSSTKKEKQPRKKEYSANWFKQFFFLSLRNWRELCLNPLATYVMVAQNLFMALLMGSIFFDFGLSQTSIQNRMGALFFVITNQSFGLIANLNLYFQERELFNRERAAGVYASSAYFLAKNFADMPIQVIVPPIIFTLASYWMCGFQSDIVHFLTCVVILIIFGMVAASLYLFVGTISPNPVVAAILAPVFTVFFLFFGGYYLNLDHIPVYYKWLYYLSFFRYAYEALLANEFKGLQFHCQSSDFGCVASGEEQLRNLGMSDVNIWENVGILGSMVVAYLLMAYICMRFLFKGKI